MSYCLILEDHPHARDWLCQATAVAFPDVSVKSCETVAAGTRLIGDELPRYALVDLGLPDGSGLDVIHLLDERRRAEMADVMIVVSTVLNDDASLFNAIRAGADGYILKEETLDGLTGMLRGISEGKPPLSASVARRLLTHFRGDEEPGVQLTPRETEVLQLIAKGFTVKKVAQMLSLTPNTTSGYVKDIYRKLNVSSRAEATLEASKRGLV